MTRNTDGRSAVDSCNMQQHVPMQPRGEAGAVRPARASELEEIRRLLAVAGLPTAGLETGFPDGFAVIESGERIAASAGVELYGSAGLLRSVVVEPAARGLGLGAELVAERISWSRARGLRELHLLTTTAADWFARFGFRPSERSSVPEAIRRSIEFVSACPASAIAMRLGLENDERSRAKYAALAASGSGCDASAVTADLYPDEDLREMPPILSLGCGNPVALAELRAGEIVLDLGSGGGLDVLLSARRVAPAGRAIGLDATEQMLSLARANQKRAGIANAEFLLGTMENIPLPDSTVDVVLSNCVLNLSVDKPRALAEARRVLRPGGRLAIADIVALRELPVAVRREAESWLGCEAGTLEIRAYAALLRSAGFLDIEILPTRTYSADDGRTLLARSGRSEPSWFAQFDGAFASAFVRARRPLLPTSPDRASVNHLPDLQP